MDCYNDCFRIMFCCGACSTAQKLLLTWLEVLLGWKHRVALVDNDPVQLPQALQPVQKDGKNTAQRRFWRDQRNWSPSASQRRTLRISITFPVEDSPSFIKGLAEVKSEGLNGLQALFIGNLYSCLV